jgi:hypothetical protein
MDEDHVKSGEKDSEVREMQQQLREAHHVIAQFYQESRELKRKLAEKAPEAHTPQTKADPKNEISKGKGVLQSPKITVSVKPSTPVTRSSARKKSADVQGQPAAIERPHTSPGEGEKTVKWLNKQLREAHDLIIQLREENMLIRTEDTKALPRMCTNHQKCLCNTFNCPIKIEEKCTFIQANSELKEEKSITEKEK